MPKEIDNKKDKNNSDLGLIQSNNAKELLNDPKLQSFFKDVDSFDKFYLDMNEFFKDKEIPQTVNQLNQYLRNKGFGDKTIEYAVEILTKEEEKDNNTDKNKKTEFIDNVKQEMMKTNDFNKLNELYNKLIKI